MTRQLLVLRHAKSAWDTDAPADFERPLARRGKKDAPRVGKWLREQGLVPDYVLSSPAKRAKQTAVAVCRELGLKKHELTWDARIYEASREQLLHLLTACPENAKTVLLVGHNPGLESLLTYLCGSDILVPEDGKLMPTAAIACLQIRVPWKALDAGVARLVFITRPRS
jgi:Phosphohistidine phosphatase SixA